MVNNKQQSIRIELTPESEAKVTKLAGAGKLSLIPIYTQIQKSYAKDVKATFERKQPRDTSLRWKSLSDKYKAIKNSNFPGKGILRATDRLFKSMTDKSHPDNITQIDTVKAAFGTKVPYANFHDDLISSRKKIPLRNFSIPNERSFENYKKTINSGIVKQLQVNGITVQQAVI